MIGFLKRTGDGGFGARMKPRPASFSAAKLDGSLSLSIRPREEPGAGVMKSHQRLGGKSYQITECIRRLLIRRIRQSTPMVMLLPATCNDDGGRRHVAIQRFGPPVKAGTRWVDPTVG